MTNRDPFDQLDPDDQAVALAAAICASGRKAVIAFVHAADDPDGMVVIGLRVWPDGAPEDAKTFACAPIRLPPGVQEAYEAAMLGEAVRI